MTSVDNPRYRCAELSARRNPYVAKKRNQVTVLLDHEEFERFESYCAERGFKKSTLIARLIRDHLDGEGYRQQRRLPLHAGPER